jgi:imidazolonepropionase
VELDLLLRHAHLVTLAAGAPDAIMDGALGVRNGRIVWLGADRDCPGGAAQEYNCGGAWVTPGLIDCHTHIVHAGNRSDEFEARLNGASYEDIARAGGGILSTVRATRQASEEALLQASLPRLMSLLAEGVTTIEIKSGYGLALEAEANMLRVARRFGQILPVRVVTTFLGAHAVPPEFAGRPDAYIDAVCGEMLPALVAEGLVDMVDAYCERIGFSAAQTERVFQAAQGHGLPVRLHAEQLSDQGGAALAARYHACSADHLEHVSPEGIAAMAGAGTVAVLLPGAWYFLREQVKPPVEALRQAGVAMALATDCNPGTSPMTSLLLAMNMGCTLFGLTPREALAACTVHAARALALQAELGTLEVGKAADLAIWDIARPADLAYGIGFNPCRAVVVGGVLRTVH